MDGMIERNRNPIQRPGHDTLLQEEFVPSRDHNLDIRWILDAASLDALLQIARAGSSGRVVIHNATLQVRTWVGGDGHRYSTIAIGGSDPQPENPLIISPRGDSVSQEISSLFRR